MTEDDVEAAARSWYESLLRGRGGVAWDELSPQFRERHIEWARTALIAAGCHPPDGRLPAQT